MVSVAGNCNAPGVFVDICVVDSSADIPSMVRVPRSLLCVQLLVHTLRIGTKGKSKKEEEVSEHNPMIFFVF